jgi:predicted MFS family arabinose efflux permease
MVLGKRLDDSYAPTVRENITVLTLLRMVSNACYRFAPPFIATIARGFDVDVADIGVALSVAELSGLLAPLIGRFIDPRSRKTSMLIGSLGVVVGVTVAATAPNIFLFAVGVFLLGAAKITFDVTMAAWFNDHVPYEKRGRVSGLVETSWALGLLVGVSAMGLMVAATNWRWGFMLGGISVFAVTLVVAARIPNEGHPTTHLQAEHGGKFRRGSWRVVTTSFLLMGASQAVYITFGAWLEDGFGFTAAALAAVGFSFGAVELAASTTSARHTDAWGKEQSVIIGAIIMVPTGILLAFSESNQWIGILLLAIFLMGFEFAIVSLLPLAAHLVPGSTGRGLGLSVGAGTFGRAAFSIPAAALYDAHGFTAPTLLGTAAALIASLLTLGFIRDKR